MLHIHLLLSVILKAKNNLIKNVSHWVKKQKKQLSKKMTKNSAVQRKLQ